MADGTAVGHRASTRGHAIIPCSHAQTHEGDARIVRTSPWWTWAGRRAAGAQSGWADYFLQVALVEAPSVLVTLPTALP